ncbi:MAG TPA: hybrid sensor histidine kinase/response regulator [Pyrinomonadaceae bacterium]|nr:hybrid sensor histidine kinase/response regulator [Pyrinomonadaceae bacterium]
MYSEGNTSPITVLLVEDDDDDFVLVKDLFRDIGNDRYKLIRVASYEEAIALESPRGFDICLMDYQLGAHDGLELMQDLVRQGFVCPMILLTGQTDEELDRRAMKAGAADYLIKGQIYAQNLERAIRYSIQQKQLAEELVRNAREQAAREEAESANQAKDDFLAVLSHELRTPLNAILGWVRLLKTNRESDEIFDKAVDAIERSAVTQTKFVEDLLDITRIVNGTIRLTMRSFVLNELTRIAYENIRPVAEARSIVLEFSAPAEEIVVHGDSERLQQVVNNLLTNAVKFTPEGGTIKLTLAKVDGNARVSVADSGQGIAPEFLPRVFERYKQANNSTTNRKGGLGLGLAIVKHLVELHGGTIAAASEGEGKGSTFSVSIPLAEAIAHQAG